MQRIGIEFDPCEEEELRMGAEEVNGFWRTQGIEAIEDGFRHENETSGLIG